MLHKSWANFQHALEFTIFSLNNVSQKYLTLSWYADAAEKHISKQNAQIVKIRNTE